MAQVYRGRTRYFRKKKRSYTVIFILIFLIAALVFYFIFTFLRARNRLYKDYYEKTLEIVKKSSEEGKEFKSIWKEASRLKREKIEEKLENLIKESNSLVKKAEDITPPREMERAHLYFVFTMELRAKGLKNYKPALFNALKDVDLEVASGQVANALKDLSLSDRAYLAFREEAEKVLKEKGVSKKYPSFHFLEENSYEKENLLPYLEMLKEAQSLKAVHGLALVSISTKPRRKRYISSRRLYILPATDIMSVTVEVENQGNVDEEDVKVKASLKSETEPEEKVYEVTIPLIKKGEKRAVTFENLLPTNEPDIVNLLTVEISPVSGEKYTENNRREFKFVLE
jgi:hypothetical protein